VAIFQILLTQKSYEIKVHKSVKKFLNEIQRDDRERLRRLILALENPAEVPHVKIKGETGVYRARVGKYRILYSIFDEEKLILVLKVDKRGRAYR